MLARLVHFVRTGVARRVCERSREAWRACRTRCSSHESADGAFRYQDLDCRPPRPAPKSSYVPIWTGSVHAPSRIVTFRRVAGTKFLVKVVTTESALNRFLRSNYLLTARLFFRAVDFSDHGRTHAAGKGTSNWLNPPLHGS